MAGTEGWGRIVYRKDERGVILDSQVVAADEETPEGFEEKAEYQTVVISPTEGPSVDESRLTTWDGLVLGQTVDVIKGDEQEGPSQPGGVDKDDVDFDEPDTVESGGEVVVGDGEILTGETVDEVKDDADQQEGPSDPGGSSEGESEDEEFEGPPPQGGPGSGKEAWSQYAASKDVSVPENATRDEIVAAVQKAGHPV